MGFLFDTQILIWAAREPERLSETTKKALRNVDIARAFSVASIWECAIKAGLQRPSFDFNIGELRNGLLSRGFQELTVSARHALSVQHLPQLHSDPFDRMLIAQAQIEGLTLLTADKMVARYPGSVQLAS